MPAEFGWESCSERIVADMEHLCDEIERLGLVFAETKFFGSTHNFPTMHAGALMACMSKLDFLSRCMDPSSTSQTARMVAFLDKYVAPEKQKENRLILQMFRHSLMHSGALRFMTNKAKTEVYTWRLCWSASCGGDRHYEISEVDSRHQSQILAVFALKHPGVPLPKTMCLHWRVTSFAHDLQVGAEAYLADASASRGGRAKLVRAYREVAMEAADT